jgi:hypothetical protein
MARIPIFKRGSPWPHYYKPRLSPDEPRVLVPFDPDQPFTEFTADGQKVEPRTTRNMLDWRRDYPEDLLVLFYLVLRGHRSTAVARLLWEDGMFDRQRAAAQKRGFELSLNTITQRMDKLIRYGEGERLEAECDPAMRSRALERALEIIGRIKAGSLAKKTA